MESLEFIEIDLPILRKLKEMRQFEVAVEKSDHFISMYVDSKYVCVFARSCTGARERFSEV